MATKHSNTTRTADEFTVNYYSNGEPAALELEPATYSVAYKRNVSREPRDNYLEFVPTYGIHVYRARGRLANRDELLRSIAEQDSDSEVEYATPVFRRSRNSQDLIYVSNQFLVKLKEDTTEEQLDAMNTENDVERAGELADREYILKVNRAGINVVDTANRYFETGLFDYAEPDLIKRRAVRATAVAEDRDRTSPASRSQYLSQQWHLDTAKVKDAWNLSTGANSVQVAILDDGVDTLHPEFAGRLGPQRDFSTGQNDGSPKTSYDKHGTACAGVAVAGGVKAYGAAPGCRLMAVRYPTSLGVAAEATMFRWSADQGASVISCSWGPPDNHGTVDPIPGPTASAIDYCVETKGVPVLFAAGNGYESVDDDGYASYRNVIAVAASTREETHSPYSDTGNAVSICAPSNGGSLSIFTTDRRGSAGYNTGSLSHGDAAGDYTSTFGGTSSSTPLVAGIVALMLSEGPNLTPAQVREILEKTADRIDESNGNYTTSPRWGAPYKHSQMYGHGRVNAHAALNWVRNNGGTTPMPATGGPTITAPGTYSRSSSKPPCFNVDASPQSHYAVEVCTDWQLLGPSDGRPARTPTNFYASWRTGTSTPALATGPQFILPQDAWERLRWADRVYFRVCSTNSSNSWEGTRFSIRSSEARQAPSITVTGSLPVPSSGTSIRGPASYDGGSDTPPSFDVVPSPNSHYAVEVATDSRLLGPQDGRPARTSENFYASWSSGTGQPNLTSSASFRISEDAWANLRSARQLYYRAITSASGSEWQQHRYTTSTGDWASAPFMSLTGNRSSRDVIPQPGDSEPTELEYPSGEVFNVVSGEDVPEVFAVPDGHAVPLIDIRERSRDQLSASFEVRDFCAPNADFTRISPRLVEGLQKLRDAVGGVKIMAGHIRNTEVTRANGAAEYLVSGVGAVIRTGRRTPLKLARAVLENVRLNRIVLGLYPDRLLVALQADPGVTAYAAPGSELSTEEFNEWVALQIPAIRDGRMVAVERPSIAGPSEYVASAPPPQFMIDPLDKQWFGVEIATRPELFNTGEYKEDRAASADFYASYRRGLTAAAGPAVFALPQAAWERLRTSPTLYYRVLTSASENSWDDMQTSLPDEQADNAPCMTVISRAAKDEIVAPTEHAGAVIVDPTVAASSDEQLWRR